jgi:hypothetical protein
MSLRVLGRTPARYFERFASCTRFTLHREHLAFENEGLGIFALQDQRLIDEVVYAPVFSLIKAKLGEVEVHLGIIR